jgi:hypothetical protein
MNWYRVLVSTEIEADDSEDAIRQANAECPGYIVESVRLINELQPPTQKENDYETS